MPGVLHSARLFLGLMILCLVVVGATLAHEGFLALATGIDVTPGGRRTWGADAMFGGVVKLLVGAGAVGLGLFGLFSRVL